MYRLRRDVETSKWLPSHKSHRDHEKEATDLFTFPVFDIGNIAEQPGSVFCMYAYCRTNGRTPRYWYEYRHSLPGFYAIGYYQCAGLPVVEIGESKCVNGCFHFHISTSRRRRHIYTLLNVFRNPFFRPDYFLIHGVLHHADVALFEFA